MAYQDDLLNKGNFFFPMRNSVTCFYLPYSYLHTKFWGHTLHFDGLVRTALVFEEVLEAIHSYSS